MPAKIRDVVFMGTPSFALPVLEALAKTDWCPRLVVTRPDAPAGRGRKLVAPPVKVLAQSLGIEVIQPADINKQVDLLGKPDIIITAAYGGYLKKAVRKLAPFGCLNVHPSILPRWRGASPVRACLAAADTTTGVSIFKIVAAMDAGPVLGVQNTPVLSTDIYTELEDRLAHMGADLLLKVLAGLETDNITPVKQDGSKATQCGKIDTTDAEIDWNLPAAKLLAFIKSLSLTPGAYCMVQGKKLKILNVKLISDSTPGFNPGQITNIIKNQGFSVCSGDGELLISLVQAQGKKVMDAAAYLRGARLDVGQQL